ncbi:MAG: LysR family transcriptional regulator [Paracoccaceae bacterium]|nr:LysR family transcriptional regulator [Paracoccaceae bacterium]
MSGQIEYIRSFLEVASEGGFSRAARVLGLSPTIVTRHVAELEAQLGVQLFTRTTRKVDLTDAGRQYRETVSGLVAQLDQANAEVRKRQVGLSGPLRISAPLSFGIRFLPDIIAQFRILHPAVDVQMELTDRFVDIAGEGFDLALRISEAPRDQTTIWRKICVIPRLLVAAPSYLSVRGTPDVPGALKDHQCLHYGHRNAARIWTLTNGEASHRITLPACFSSNNGDLIAQLAIRNEGIALLPEFIVKAALNDTALQPVLSDWNPPEIWLTTTVPPYDRLPAKVAAFIDFVEAHMKECA